jgi:hypothetical protein
VKLGVAGAIDGVVQVEHLRGKVDEKKLKQN